MGLFPRLWYLTHFKSVELTSQYFLVTRIRIQTRLLFIKEAIIHPELIQFLLTQAQRIALNQEVRNQFDPYKYRNLDFENIDEFILDYGAILEKILRFHSQNVAGLSE